MIGQRFSIGPADAEIAMMQWGESGKPPALLVHGTGFAGDVWDKVARELASTYTEARAAALIPQVSERSFAGVGHCAGQENPTPLLDALRIFAANDR
ncbi:hypothetical protein [Bradyrhizobium agreste]|uniref:hypothetical protein n=1 Tax=Bradyrhizobium agreste TaxID=2751811 RepID=UPI001FEB1AE3|nr:hypothetical protein [Bradyrhizobium agreste]